MAGNPSNKAVVKVTAADGTLTKVRNFNSAALASAIAELDVSSSGEDDMEYEPGQASHTFTSGGPWTKEDHALFRGILKMRGRSLEFFPIGEDTGNPKSAASCFVTAYSANTDLGSAASYSVTIRISGAVTDTIQP